MLDERLSMAAEMYPKCDMGADIGADHGKLALHLVQTGRCKCMQVTDISESSLNKARKLFAEQNMSDRAMFLCGDGFHALAQPAECASILGMGGKTICQIISNQDPFGPCKQLLLSPHTDLVLVRKTLYALGYVITDERIVCSGGRFYVLIKAMLYPDAGEQLSDRLAFLGPCLLQKKSDGCVAAYYQWVRSALSVHRDAQAAEWVRWLDEL